MKLWDIEHDRREWLRRMGDISQAAYVRKSVLDDGPGRGMRVWEVTTGSGFTFTVLPDRCLDIAQCAYQGVPLSFISRVGLMHPHHYGDDSFLRAFTAGLLTTCGGTYMGAACEDDGERLGLHGRLHAAAADETYAGGRWIADDYFLTISGEIREASVFGEHLRLRRTITCRAGESKLCVHDVVINDGFTPTPLMLLYHCNFGYPFVSEHSVLTTSQSAGVTPRDETAAAGLGAWQKFDAPVHGYREQVFYHALTGGEDGYAWACLRNEPLKLGAYVKYHTENLPLMIQWKQMGEGDYVCGLEPSTARPDGRDKNRARGELRMLAPGASAAFLLEIGVEKYDFS